MSVSQLNPVLSGLTAPNAAEQGPGVPSTSSASVGPVIGFAEVLGSTFSSLGQGLTTGSGNLPEGTPLAQRSDILNQQSALAQKGTSEKNSADALAKQNSTIVPGAIAHILPGEELQANSLNPSSNVVAPSAIDEPIDIQPILSAGNQGSVAVQQPLNTIQPIISAKAGNTDNLQTQLSTTVQQVTGANIEPGSNSAVTKNAVSAENAVSADRAISITQTIVKPETVPAPDAKLAANNASQQALLSDEKNPQQDRSFNKQGIELQASLKENAPQKLFERIGAGQNQLPAGSAPAAISADKLEQLNLSTPKTIGLSGDMKFAQKPKKAQVTVAPAQQAVPTADQALMGQHLGAVNAATSNSFTGSAAATPGLQSASPPSIPVSDIAVHMVQNKNAGTNEFTIRLTPESMGTITVKLNLSKDAGISGVLQVEKPETLALLQKDVAQLEKALKSQGLNAKDGSFTLVLKNPGNVAKAAEGLAQLAAGATGNSADNQTNATSQNSAGQNSFGQNSSGQNANNQAVNSHNSNVGQQPNSSNGFEKSLGNASSTGGEQNFQQSSREHGEDRQAQMQSSSQQGQQDQQDTDPTAELQDYNENEVPEAILSAYAARNMHINMSARLDLSV